MQHSVLYVSVMSLSQIWGKQALMQHMQKDKHLKTEKSHQNQTNRTTFVKPSSSTLSSSDMVLSAEMRWISFLAEHVMSMNTLTDIGQFFPTMFPDFIVAQNLSCERTKATYLLSNGIQPALTQSLIMKLKQTKFSLLIDESKSIMCTIYPC